MDDDDDFIDDFVPDESDDNEDTEDEEDDDQDTSALSKVQVKMEADGDDSDEDFNPRKVKRGPGRPRKNAAAAALKLPPLQRPKRTYIKSGKPRK